MPTSSPGFTVRLAAGDPDLRSACAVRAAAYGHHLPALPPPLAEPDALDRQ